MIYEKTGAAKVGNAVIDISQGVQEICDKLDLVPAEVSRLLISPNTVHVMFLDGSQQTFAVKA